MIVFLDPTGDRGPGPISVLLQSNSGGWLHRTSPCKRHHKRHLVDFTGLLAKQVLSQTELHGHQAQPSCSQQRTTTSSIVGTAIFWPCGPTRAFSTGSSKAKPRLSVIYFWKGNIINYQALNGRLALENLPGFGLVELGEDLSVLCRML
jgi:hypothetical protein